jgi:hypothetical protein
LTEGRGGRGQWSTHLKPVVVLTVRREISSTLGRKTASWVEPEKKALL